jgi:ketosteroid isomerase-like protein
MAIQDAKRGRRPGDATNVAAAFVERINAQDVEGLCELMTKDHRFVDSIGEVHVGRERMREGWLHYFATFPDYHVTVESTFSAGMRVALFGTTSATYAPNGMRVEVYAAWLAIVRGKRLAEWRVYADNEPARAAMRHKRRRARSSEVAFPPPER